MKKLKVLALALLCAAFSPAKADEGMWLLQLMQGRQNESSGPENRHCQHL